MPGSHRARSVALFLCLLLASIGCASSSSPVGDESTGSLSLDLTIADRFQIDEVRWEITGNDMPAMMGTIDTGAPGSTASVEVFGIPEGDDFLITMEATSTNGELSCEGSANFDVVAGAATEVHVMLNCSEPGRLGGVRVNGKFNICAELAKVIVSPLQTSVGNDIDLHAEAIDQEGDPVAFLWSANGGSIAAPTQGQTTYTCTTVGYDEITITVSDDMFTYCTATWTVPITCVQGEGDLCEDVVCDDAEECTTDTCDPANGQCQSTPVNDGISCDDGAGTCMSGDCVDVDLCLGVVCDDLGECQNNACSPASGECEASDVPNGTSCDGGDGTCTGGECVDSDLCIGVVCDDLGECQLNACNSGTGLCEASDAPDGTTCADGTCQGGSCVATSSSLDVVYSGPPSAFADSEVELVVEISNNTGEPATDVVLVLDLPDDGSFVSVSPPNAPAGDSLTVNIGSVSAGGTVVVTLTWLAPGFETTLSSEATVSAAGAADVSDGVSVAVGTSTIVTGGATVAGTGLRNRASGTISITDVPSNAVVTRAVLVWALLFQEPVPSNQITFEGELVTADLTQTVSDRLCWNDFNTIGYAADVTALVSGNGDYIVSDPVNTVVRLDSSPISGLPLTDGASLIVFYGGPGLNAQVLSDFSYSAESGGSNFRMLDGVESVGGAATLYLAGPDGQAFIEEGEIMGAGSINIDDQWDGSDPQDGPDFAIGNLWDTDVYDVSSILPAGQSTLGVEFGTGPDCTGLSAIVLEVEQ
ncbi:MAG: hypothetical protein AAGF92_22785 [Myxococcota bacterium]